MGSLIGEDEDIKRRKILATAAMNKLNNIWNSKTIKRHTKIKTYKTLVKSILLYNSGTWGMTKGEEEKIDAFHRKQLKRILQIKYPTKIKNEILYKKTNEEPVSNTIRMTRWKLFGHILRRTKNIPAYQAMENYFSKTENTGFRGKRRTTLPTTLNDDLDKLHTQTNKHLTDHNYYKRLTLHNKTDLETLRELAQERKTWKRLAWRVGQAGNAETSDESSAESH